MNTFYTEYTIAFLGHNTIVAELWRDIERNVGLGEINVDFAKRDFYGANDC